MWVMRIMIKKQYNNTTGDVGLQIYLWVGIVWLSKVVIVARDVIGDCDEDKKRS